MKASLTVREAGFLLQRTERQTRYMIEQGMLVRSTPGSSVTPASVVAHFPLDGKRSLLDLAKNEILRGRFSVPAPASRYEPPAPLSVFMRWLDARS